MYNASEHISFLQRMSYDAMFSPSHVRMAQPSPTPPSILETAWSSALRGGIPGMAAMGVQVSTLMWLRTTMNFQYRYGTTMTQAMRTLYAQGGIPRFYSGYTAALIQGPLSRFGDTAANSGMLALLDNSPTTKDLPIAMKTAAASTAAALFRILLMPVDTIKTMMQVEGSAANLFRKVQLHGPSTLFHGSVAASVATLAGHYPWYTTYNYLNHFIPNYHDNVVAKLTRSAAIGFTCSMVSDTVSNSFRVVKTARQTSTTSMTYRAVIRDILRKDGIQGLLGRGLKTRLLTNGVQGLLFSVLWRLGQDYYAEKTIEKEKA